MPEVFRTECRRRDRSWLLRVLTTAVASALLVGGVVAPSTAAPQPSAPEFDKSIDAYPKYESETGCDPAPKPGTAALQRLIHATYGSSPISNISRVCSGASSGHEEGRSIDWMTNARVPSQDAMADAFITWLLAPDEHGNQYAMARRLGVQYVIYDSMMFRLYRTSDGWREYNGCLTTQTSPALDNTCHRNHVHISMTWAGANQQTSWWSPKGTPFGSIDTMADAGHAIRFSGWAIDPDTTAPLYVWVDVAGEPGFPIMANGSRPDVGAVYPASGSAHGFSATIPLQPGSKRVCLTAVNVGKGGDRSLGCRTVTVVDRSPIGNFEVAADTGHALTLTGWALDPETTASQYVWVDVRGSAGFPVIANGARPDVRSAIKGAGDRHGFTSTIPRSPGPVTVCLTAVNSGVGTDRSLGCRTVNVVDRSPSGNVEGIADTGRSLTLTGWALDPETTGPVYVWVDPVGSAGFPVLADVARPDVRGAIKGAGERHGFSVVVPRPAGTHTVCLTAVNAGAGADKLLGCRRGTVR